MGFAIRAMQPADLDAVSRLMVRVFPQSHSPAQWAKIMEWMYFSPSLADGRPRALVIADAHSIVGHIGCTVSPFTDGRRYLRVVNPANWVVDPECKAGLLAVRLMLEIGAAGDLVMVIGGGEQTQRIIPKLGYKEWFRVERYIKVLKPWRLLGSAPSGRAMAHNAVKLGLYWTGRVQAMARNGHGRSTPVYQWREMDKPKAPEPIESSTNVMRNALDPQFLAWFKQCPEGSVHVLGLYDGQQLIGHVSVLIMARGSRRWANLLGAETWIEAPSVWSSLLNATEEFLQGQQVTHINAVGCYAPWCEALRRHGYTRLKSNPVRLRSKPGQLKDVAAWHVTAIEGDLGYLME